MLHGFLFGLGLWLSLVSVLLLFVLIKKLKPRIATVEIWKEYLQKATDNQDFKEASFVQDLIKDKDSKDLIRTPKGYKLMEESDMVWTEKGKGFTVSSLKRRWIEKAEK